MNCARVVGVGVTASVAGRDRDGDRRSGGRIRRGGHVEVSRCTAVLVSGASWPVVTGRCRRNRVGPADYVVGGNSNLGNAAGIRRCGIGAREAGARSIASRSNGEGNLDAGDNRRDAGLGNSSFQRIGKGCAICGAPGVPPVAVTSAASTAPISTVAVVSGSSGPSRRRLKPR